MRLLSLAIVLLPFQQAFTLHLGFPLKATEVLGALGVVASFAIPRRVKYNVPAVAFVWALGLLVMLSSLIAFTRVPPVISHPGYPQGFDVDLILYTGYAAFAIIIFVTLVRVVPWPVIARSVSLAVRVAAGYAIVQFVLWAAGIDLLQNVGGSTQIGTLYGIGLPRNGSFLEGNYLGFFAATTLFVMWQIRDRMGILCAVFLVFYAQSTGAIVAIVAGLLAILVLRPRARFLAVFAALLASASALVYFVPQANSYFVRQLAKLGLVSNEFGESYSYSLRGRSLNAEIGFDIANSHPLLGVGQGRYALYYESQFDVSGIAANVGYGVTRPIANNSYAQIAAETGWLALAVVVMFIAALALRARRVDGPVTGLVVSIGVGMIASPAWTGLPIWVMLAVVCSILVWRQLAPRTDGSDVDPVPVEIRRPRRRMPAG